MAKEKPGQTLQATALVHEAWIRLSGSSEQQWENRRHFFAAAAESMRRILVERARRRQRVRHGGNLDRADSGAVEIASTQREHQLVAMDEALEKLEAEDPQKAQVGDWLAAGVADPDGKE